MAAGGAALKILHLEDNPGDAELVRAFLHEDGIVCEIIRVESLTEFEKILRENGVDLIVSDFTLPTTDGLSALSVARKVRPEVPFIFLSGTIGEERAAEAVRMGATDYILKDRPLRLVTAVRRALRESKENKRSGSLEAQLRLSQRMEVVGRLAGGVAHDFNNLLTVISGRSEIVFSELGPTHPCSEDLSEVLEAASRAASLTRQLLAFSRQQVLQPRILDLNALIRDLTRMLRRLIGEDLELTTHLAPGVLPVKADPGQLEQVIMNLAVNARDAMPDGGRLSVETLIEDLGEEYARRNLDMKPGRYVSLSIGDTGEGIAAENLPFIFEPFFTTKEPGKGTGLGLAMVYGIVKQSGGHINVSSEPGRGSLFRIHLPGIEEAPEEVQPAGGARSVPGGSETVLLVEDDEMVRAVTARMLRKIGYVVLEAPHPMLALQAAENHPGDIHLVVSDIVMPVIDGWEFVRRLRVARPLVKALMMSGYPGRGFPSAQMDFPSVVYLPKPFSAEVLAVKVREALDGNNR
ncbi:MAG: response regulator [Nitrospirae bacterium]|nr:response regulator [Nitrospirota bacterium]